MKRREGLTGKIKTWTRSCTSLLDQTLRRKLEQGTMCMIIAWTVLRVLRFLTAAVQERLSRKIRTWGWIMYSETGPEFRQKKTWNPTCTASMIIACTVLRIIKFLIAAAVERLSRNWTASCTLGLDETLGRNKYWGSDMYCVYDDSLYCVVGNTVLRARAIELHVTLTQRSVGPRRRQDEAMSCPALRCSQVTRSSPPLGYYVRGNATTREVSPRSGIFVAGLRTCDMP